MNKNGRQQVASRYANEAVDNEVALNASVPTNHDSNAFGKTPTQRAHIRRAHARREHAPARQCARIARVRSTMHLCNHNGSVGSIRD